MANSTPIVDLDSRLNSLRVNRDSRFDFPTPESPISTTEIEKFQADITFLKQSETVIKQRSAYEDV